MGQGLLSPPHTQPFSNQPHTTPTLLSQSLLLSSPPSTYQRRYFTHLPLNFFHRILSLGCSQLPPRLPAPLTPEHPVLSIHHLCPPAPRHPPPPPFTHQRCDLHHLLLHILHRILKLGRSQLTPQITLLLELVRITEAHRDEMGVRAGRRSGLG